MRNQSFSDPEISFGVLADLQYCDADPLKDRHFRNSKHKLARIIEDFNNQKLDFIINLGDTIDRDWISYNEILPLFKEFQSPVYHVLGNHDYEVEDYRKSQVPESIGTDKYYDFSINSWRFIILDGNEISTYANIAGSENYLKAEKLLAEQNVNSNFWNGGIGNERLTWLKEKLQKASKNHEKAVLFCHFPIYPADRHNLLNDCELLDIIHQHSCVKAWFNGHNHHGNYGMLHDTHFVNVKGIVETEAATAYSIVHLHNDRLEIHGKGDEISARLIIE